MFLFRPGSLGGAPHTYVAFVQGPAEPQARARLQRDTAERYPNVSVIDGLTVIETVRRVLGYVTLAITVVGAVALFSGALILIGSVAMTKFQRIHDAAVLRVLGGNTRMLASMLALEYGVLGLLAGAVGSAAALVLTWALARQVLEITWFPSLLTNVIGMAVTAAAVGATGVVASLDVLRRKPLATLRAE
ncbi:MAG: FtsX-like permease family protein [Acidobacteria bacterium]|nr:FtsX-like permease family protein [Acidobacteriota bacterium]